MSQQRNMRDGWPVELTFLLERHPRPTWRSRDSATVAFWLAVHDHLRRAAVGLETTADDYRAARLSTAQLAVVAAPRLNGLVAGLDGHHQIEDFHYFPTFRSAEPRLATGFDRLEAEHVTMAHEVRAALGALAELRAAAERGDEPHDASLAAQHFLSASAELCRHLREHLDDEEALVVPLLLERGDV